MSKSLRYNNNKPKWGMVHFKSLLPLVRVLEYGAHKYSVFIDNDHNEVKGADISPEDASKLTLKSSGRDNWKIDLDPTETLESAFRHLSELMDGNPIDEESKLEHVGHLMCNLMFYQYHTTKQKGLSDEG